MLSYLIIAQKAALVKILKCIGKYFELSLAFFCYLLYTIKCVI